MTRLSSRNPTYANLRASVRGSLFWVPLLLLLTGLGLAALTGAGDAGLRGGSSWLSKVVPVSAQRAATVLQVIATSTITVAGLVASVMVVAVQLSSSQFSPRVLRRFLRHGA